MSDPFAPIKKENYSGSSKKKRKLVHFAQGGKADILDSNAVNSYINAEDDAIQPTASPIDLIAGGLGSMLGSGLAAGAEGILGNEIGTLGEGAAAKGAGIINDISQAGKVLDSSGAEFPTVNGVPQLGKVTVQDLPPAPTGGKIIQKFAEGGAISLDSPDVAGYLGAQSAPNSSLNLDSPELDKYLAPEKAQEEYGTPGQQTLAGLEGVAKGVLGPAATYAEVHSGLTTPEAIRGRSEANPLTAGVGEAAGFGGSLLTGSGEAALIGEAGEAAAKAAGFGDRISSKAIQAATEMGLLQSGDELSKLITNDPDQSAQTAVTNVGLSSLLGGAAGGTLGAISPLWEAVSGNKAAQEVSNFKGRLAWHAANPEPTAQVTDELTHYFNTTRDAVSDVYGAQGLKAQNLAKIMPEMSQEIASSTGENVSRLEKGLEKLSDDPLAGKLADKIEAYKAAVTPEINPITLKPVKEISPSQIFDATNDLKQQLQEWGKFHKDMVPLAEHDFRNEAKSLARDLRMSLEDEDVWGKVGTLQKDLNAQVSKYIPAEKDFLSKFSSKLLGEKEIDPAKINTYMNQLGKPNAELKQSMLRNYLDASENYRNQIDKLYKGAGLESPIKQESLAGVRSTLQELTPGMKLADTLYKKILPEGSSKLLGGILGHATGLGELGTMMGAFGLGPSIEKILPSLLKPILSLEASGSGIKAAGEYATQVSKGENLISKAAKNMFKAGAEILPEHAIPSETSRNKLDKMLKEIQKSPAPLLAASGSPIGHYMAAHNTALGKTAANASTYLNSIRPEPQRKSPLDTPTVASAVEKASYNNALNIAEQPLIVLDKIKQGTITIEDVRHLKAMYPDLYARTAQKLNDEMITHVSKGEAVPYKTRIGLSMYLGQPLDSSMTPESIQASQASNNVMKPGTESQPQGQAQAGQKTPRSTTSLNKLPSSYRTPGQARNLDNQTKE